MMGLSHILKTPALAPKRVRPTIIRHDFCVVTLNLCPRMGIALSNLSACIAHVSCTSTTLPIPQGKQCVCVVCCASGQFIGPLPVPQISPMFDTRRCESHDEDCRVKMMYPSLPLMHAIPAAVSLKMQLLRICDAYPANHCLQAASLKNKYESVH